MPRRTNLFQEVVSIIYTHLVGEAAKEESAMLVNRLTGYKREVDVVLRTRIAGHEAVIAIEAAARGRRPSVEWVEQMIGKHRNLPTDKVVLVSEAGFSKQALALAQAEKMDALTQEDVEGDAVDGVLRALPSLWPKTVSLTPEAVRIWVKRPDDTIVWFKAAANVDIVFGDGTESDVLAMVRGVQEDNWPRIVEQIGLAGISEDTESDYSIQFGPPVTAEVDGEPHELFVRWIERPAPELHRIERIVIDGKAQITVSEIPLTAKRLGDINVRYAYGHGTIGGKPKLVVITEHGEGGKLSVRDLPERNQPN